MFYPIVCTQFIKMLGNLSAILNQAESFAADRNFDVEVLLNARLAPDQFNFIRQIQLICDTARTGAARLAGTDSTLPSQPDTECTLQELQTRITSTLTYLKTLTADDFEHAGSRRISQPRWKGKSLSGAEFFAQHIVPNFYFHFTTAYSILRHNGVPVGKKNYLGPMPYRE